MALTPTQIKTLCAEYGLSPSKAYGQHYLISETPIKAMIQAAKLRPDETVIEVGPGFGVLTFALSEVSGQVFALEIEQTLSRYWEDEMEKHANIQVIWGNARDTFSRVLTEQKLSTYSVVANLPYQVTSELMRLFLESVPQPRQVVVMVQREVAERMCAKPGDLSLLGVATQYYGAAKIVTHVPPGAFWPPPKVDSAVVQIDCNIPPRPVTKELFFLVVRAAFAQKRKKAVSNIADGLHLEKEKVIRAFEAAGLSSGIRAEDISLEAWFTLIPRLF